MKSFSVFVISLLIFVVQGQQPELKIVKNWKKLDFIFPNPSDRTAAIAKGTYVAQNVFPIDVDVDYRGPMGMLQSPRIFVTTPRFSEGVPVTLGYIKASQSGPLIQPYPDYSWHSSHGANCSGLTSVVRVAIDSCSHMYVLDSGVINDVIKCPPQLLIFNLRNDKLIHRYKFPESQYSGTSLFVTPVLDTKNPEPFGRCTDTKVYIADVTGFSLLVYDAAKDSSWMIKNNLFNANENYKTFTIAGESFELMDGVLGLALSSARTMYMEMPFGMGKQVVNDRTLYFHSLAAISENSVSTNLLNDASNWKDDANGFDPSAFREIGSRAVQTPAQAMDSNGNMFFVLLEPLALVCWDSSSPYSTENFKIIYQNDETLQFASGVKIVKNALGMEELWVMTNRFQKVMAKTLNLNEVNFRIMTNTVMELLRGSTRCNGGSLV